MSCPKCGGRGVSKDSLVSKKIICKKCGYTIFFEPKPKKEVLSSLKKVIEEEIKYLEKELLKKQPTEAFVEHFHEGLLTLSIDPGERFEVGDVTGLKRFEIEASRMKEKVEELGVVMDVEWETGLLRILVTNKGLEGLLNDADIIYILEVEPLISLNKQLEVLENVKEGGEWENNPAAKLVFERFEQPKTIRNDVKPEDYLDIERKKELDSSQKQIVEEALSLKEGELLLVIGPPGCGKTVTIRKIAYEFAKRKEKVLIASHTNIAVDNALEGLPLEYSLRIGRPEKILDVIKPYMLGVKAKEAAGEKLKMINDKIAEIKKELNPLEREYKKRKEEIWKPYTEKIEWYKKNFRVYKEMNIIGLKHSSIPSEIMKIREECKRREETELKELKERINALKDTLGPLYHERDFLLKNVSEKLIDDSLIIGSTLVKSQLPPLEEVNFDVAIIDESSQASFTLALLAMVKAKKWILVGDQNQLLPIFKSIRSMEKCIDLSAFSFLLQKYPFRRSMLKYHYRSNSDIIGFSKKFIYNNNKDKIEITESCKSKFLKLERLLAEDGWEALKPEKPVVFIHVKSEETKEGGSRYNKKECEVIERIVRLLIKFGVKGESIGIISPYREQTEHLRRRIKEIEEIKTVDGFQGREKDVIIFSVTSTSGFKFVSHPNRLNVALTRAIYKLIVVGNAERIMTSSEKLLLRKFLEYVDSLGNVYNWEGKKFERLQEITEKNSFMMK